MWTRRARGQVGIVLCTLATFSIIAVLFLIIGNVFMMGLPSLSWYFLTTPENQTPGLGQGIANAIIGTVIIATLATVLATPLGIGTAVYLQRYARKNRITETFRFLIEVLSGTPSIVIGIFGIMTLVYVMKKWTGGFSLISGTIALAILISPVIIRSVENAIESVPRELEEASYAVGANKWQTVRNVTLPVAIAGIFTGVILAFGRAAEESAVVILTAGYSQFIPELAIKQNDKLALGVKIYPFQDLVGTLPYSVYHAYINSNVVPISAGFAAAFILICVVLCINLAAKVVFSYNMSGSPSKSGFPSSITVTLTGFLARFRRIPGAQPAIRGQQKSDIIQDAPAVSIQETVAPALPDSAPSIITGQVARDRVMVIQPGDRFFEGLSAGNPSDKESGGDSVADCTTPHVIQANLAVTPEPTNTFQAQEFNPGIPAAAEPGSSVPASPVREARPLQSDTPTGAITAPGIDRAAESAEHPGSVQTPKSRDAPSILDGFPGVILASAGMVGFLGLVYGIRIATKDASLEVGEVLLVAALIAVVGGVAVFQYVRLHRRAA